MRTYLILVVILGLILIASQVQAGDDAAFASKDQQQGDFQMVPAWSRYDHMPVLPDELKPFGKQVTPAPTPAPVATTPAPTPTPTPAPTTAKQEAKDLTSIAPFLEWVKQDPAAAAALARKEAAKYEVPAPTSLVVPQSDNTRPYWLPPVQISTDSGASTTQPTPVTGSSAVYQRPSE